MNESGKLKGVCIGAGYFSQYHYEAWSRISKVEISAISDLKKEPAQRFMNAYGIERYYENFREMLDQEQPDFVDIITPPVTHYELCQYASEKGVAIICQKPLTPTYEESVNLVKRVAQSSTPFVIHENFRWQPWYREAKRLFLNHTLGPLHSIYLRMRPGDGWGEDAYLNRQPYFREYPRFLMYETGVHYIDTFRFLGGEIKRVYAYLRRLNPVIQGEDSGIITFVFESGATAVLDANRYNEVESDDPRYTFGEFRIDAGKGHIELDFSGTMRIKMLGEKMQQHVYPHENRGFSGDCCYAFQQHFVECLLANKPFESGGNDYLKTLRVLEACYQSAETGQVIEL